jgi:tape measure domain-containing protein
MANSIAKLAIQLTTDTKGMTQGFAQARQHVSGLQQSLASLAAGAGGGGGGLSGMVGMLGKAGPVGLAAAAAIAAVGAAAAITYKALTPPTRWAAELENSTVAFKVMLGSAADAKNMLAGIKSFALESPFSKAGLTQSAQTLMQFGVEGKNVLSTLRMLGDISIGDANRLQSLSLAFGQMTSAGRLMGQDLLQMINAGFNPLNEISKKTGESMLQLKKRMEGGGISAAEVGAAFQQATSEGGRFHGMMNEMSKTWDGEWAKMGEQLKEMFTPIGKLVIQEIKPMVAGLNVILETTNRWLGIYETDIPKAIEGVNQLKLAHDVLNESLIEMKDNPMKKGLLAQFTEFEKLSQDAAKRMEDDRNRGKELANSLRTPGETFAADAMQLNDMLRAGTITGETFARAMAKAREELADANKSAREMQESLKPSGIAALSRFSTEGRSSVLTYQRNFQQQQIDDKRRADQHAETNRLLKEANRINAGGRVQINEVSL